MGPQKNTHKRENTHTKKPPHTPTPPVQDAVPFLGILNDSIIELLDRLVERAHEMRASDIHIDPRSSHVSVRFRIDGVLQHVCNIPKETYPEVISRAKVCARLRTDEHQTPQDGRFRVITKDGKPIDVRASIVPTYHGENAVLRLLVDQHNDFTLEALGFSPLDTDKILRAIRRPSGMILSTGPTGSGKTTTLYALIQLLATPGISVVTIEDPIEYAVDGIEQIQINPQTHLTFASGLRSILRQDPDIIMVGEIRDHETAALAVNTALTGHLLLSTLHTNDAATTLPRLLDMRIEPYLIASTVSIAIAQRLVRKLCPACTENYTPTDAEKSRVQEALPTVDPKAPYFRGKGCTACAHTGFQGRTSVNEVLVMNPDIREAILNKASSDEIRVHAISNGMTTMLEDGLTKAHLGKTSLSEIFRIVAE